MRRIYNEKQIAGLLALVLLCSIPFPAYAADIETPQLQIVSVKYSDIDQMVRTSNQTIRANVKSLDSLQNNDVIAEKQQELSSSAAALQDVNKCCKMHMLQSIPWCSGNIRATGDFSLIARQYGIH